MNSLTDASSKVGKKMLDTIYKINLANYTCTNRQFPVCLAASSAYAEHFRVIDIDTNDLREQFHNN